MFIILNFQPSNKGNTDVALDEFNNENFDPWWSGLSHDITVRKSHVVGQAIKEKEPILWPGYAYGFVAGFVNITFGMDSPNASVCLSNVTRIVSSSLDFGEHITVLSNDSWKEAGYDFQMMFETIHPIFFSCYQTAFEYFEVALLYGKTFTEW